MHKLKFPLLMLAISVSLLSCLKDKAFMDVSNTQALIEFTALGGVGGNNAATVAAPLSFSLVPPLTIIDTVITVNIASPQVLNQNVAVTIAVDTTLVGLSDTANGNNYEVLPDSLYSVPNLQITIPAGYRIGKIPIKLKLTNYDFINHKYAIGFRITDAKGLIISSNANSFLLSLDVRNKYDGIYTMKGYTLRAGDATKTGNFNPMDMPLITAGASSVQFGATQVWADNTGVAPSVGQVTLTVTEAGTLYPVTISSAGGSSNDPGYTSVYNPAKKTFYISYTWGAGPTARLATDTLIYKGRRP